MHRYFCGIRQRRIAFSTTYSCDITSPLSAKYAIALSANDSYAGDDNAKGDYDHRVIGIGKASGIVHNKGTGSGLTLFDTGFLSDDGRRPRGSDREDECGEAGHGEFAKREGSDRFYHGRGDPWSLRLDPRRSSSPALPASNPSFTTRPG